MQNEQKKSPMVSIITGVVVIGAAAALYYIFTNKGQPQSPVVEATSVGNIASETVLMGADIESTVKDLDNLKRAVESATIIFGTPAFQSLQDFSVVVPGQPIGRQNPFVLTSWKLKIKELEKSTGSNTNSTNSLVGAQAVVATGATTTVPRVTAPSSTGMLGTPSNPLGM